MGIAYGKGWGSIGFDKDIPPKEDGIYLVDLEGYYYTPEQASILFSGVQNNWGLLGVAVIDSRSSFIIPFFLDISTSNVRSTFGKLILVRDICNRGIVPNVNYTDQSLALSNYNGKFNTDEILDFFGDDGAKGFLEIQRTAVTYNTRLLKKYLERDIVSFYVPSLGEIAILRERWDEISSAVNVVEINVSNNVTSARIHTSTLLGESGIYSWGLGSAHSISSSGGRTGTVYILPISTLPDWSKLK